MGNSVRVLFCFTPGRPPRGEAAELPGLSVDESEVDVGIADDPVAVSGFGHADGLSDEDFTDEADGAPWPKAAQAARSVCERWV
jgi:hypothetical protein